MSEMLKMSKNYELFFEKCHKLSENVENVESVQKCWKCPKMSRVWESQGVKVIVCEWESVHVWK